VRLNGNHELLPGLSIENVKFCSRRKYDVTIGYKQVARCRTSKHSFPNDRTIRGSQSVNLAIAAIYVDYVTRNLRAG
jgi:hypothetical protein